jgi:hypothetical protein
MKMLRIRIVNADVLEHSGGVADLARQVVGEALKLAGEVVLVVQVVEGLVLVDEIGHVLGVLGNVRCEILDLADDVRDQQRPEPDRDQDQRAVGERDREPPLHPPLQQVDRS